MRDPVISLRLDSVHIWYQVYSTHIPFTEEWEQNNPHLENHNGKIWFTGESKCGNIKGAMQTILYNTI